MRLVLMKGTGGGGAGVRWKEFEEEELFGDNGGVRRRDVEGSQLEKFSGRGGEEEEYRGGRAAGRENQ
ncbi:hypothetical protein Pmani_020009 [Petrolisthes manimaculis]|uniref:Uncharacterized protein n=1 Tax=Petrolisthes manimaculis TaxID=1843537 RepID=A0AAE1U6U5_9EUCA|nr:hypothetical protein Pmani_020009 [Petrolisthes manimaculis]